MTTKTRDDLIYFISGMWCSTCAKSITNLVTKLDGVASAQVNYTTKLLLVKPKDPNVNESLDHLIQHNVNRIGFSIKRQPQNWLLHFKNELQNETEQKITWIQVGLVWFLAMWSSMFAFTGYLGGLTDSELFYLSLVSSVFGLPAIFIGAYPYAKAGLKALFYSHLLTFDLFIFLGAMSAISITVFSHFTAYPVSYADSGSMILALLLSTKKLENTISQSATLKILFQIHPKQNEVEVYKKDQWKIAQVFQIKTGDLVRIKKNETIAFDGTLENDTTKINNHLISGEDHEVPLKKGDHIFAGAIALDETLIRISATPGQRKIDAWAEKALVAENSKDRFQNLFLKVESGLVVMALAGAALIGLVHFLKAEPYTKVIESFFIGILIFCPCLFASIIPLSKKLSHLALYQKGILLSRSEALLDLLYIKNFYFDKTGTLETVESSFVPFQNEELILPYLKEISIRSKHIILRELKILDEVKAQPLLSLVEYPGKGLIAEINDQQEIKIGRPEFLAEHGVKNLQGLDPMFSYIALNKDIVGQILQQKIYNKKSKEFLKNLLKLMPRLHIEILSGDPDLNAKIRYTNIDSRIKYHGGLSPEDKKDKIKPQSAFIGDGLNDTMALAKSQVSFRIGSRISGQLPVDFYLERPDLNLILELLQHSKKYRRVLIQTGLAAIVYNLIAITLAIFGKFSPLGAVIAMISSFSLMLLSVSRLQTLKKEDLDL